jgi:glycosyltransferase involved in cell wall biosynthesis
MSPLVQPFTVMHLISSLRLGGSERLLVSTMQAAARERSQPYVIVVMNDRVDESLFAELKATGFPVYRLDRPQGHVHPRYLTRLLGIVRRHGVRFIHTHNDGSLAWGMALKTAWPRLKLVYTQHAQGGALEFTGMRRQAYRALVGMTVAISPFIARETNELAKGRVTLAPNGINLDRFRIEREPMRIREPTRLVQVARIARIKGQDIAIRALRRCIDLRHAMRLTIVGTASEPEYFEEIKALIASLDLEAHVDIVLDRTDVERFLADSDIFVLASRHEGFGLAIVEAMAAGTPVVASATGGAKDLVADGVNGLRFTPEDDGDLAMALLRMSSDIGLRRACAHAGFETASAFDVKHTLDALNRMYRRLYDPTFRADDIGAQGVETTAASDTPWRVSPTA